MPHEEVKKERNRIRRQGGGTATPPTGKVKKVKAKKSVKY